MTEGLGKTIADALTPPTVATPHIKQLSESFAGREFDDALLRDLPPEVDSCGEHGEFHTCVYNGPMFTNPVRVEAGEIVHRDGFVYADFK